MIELSLEKINTQSPYEVSYAPNGDFVFATILVSTILFLSKMKHRWAAVTLSNLSFRNLTINSYNIHIVSRVVLTLKIARLLCVTLDITPAAMLGC